MESEAAIDEGREKKAVGKESERTWRKYANVIKNGKKVKKNSLINIQSRLNGKGIEQDDRCGKENGRRRLVQII